MVRSRDSGLPISETWRATFQRWQPELNARLKSFDDRLDILEAFFNFSTDWEPKYSASSGTFTADTEYFKLYSKLGDLCVFLIGVDGTTSATADRLIVSPPLEPAENNFPVYGRTINGSGDEPAKGGASQGSIFVRRGAGAGNWTAGSGRQFYLGGIYRVAEGAALL